MRPFAGVAPRLGSGVYLAPTAAVVGDVTLGDEVSLWYGAVLRGDVGTITIGHGSNVQDLACIHMSLGISNAEIGRYVTIGHQVTIHGAKVGDGALIGIGAILLDNSVIGSEAWVAAGSLVPAGMQVPPRTLVRGQPARPVRDLTEAEWREGRKLAERYIGVAREHARVDAAGG
ncbi:MAG TPA: gamma carbonic anhydrase family protein [Polyangiaceae bacterium]|nr:gamma carbonic anhydrase family protein [Polyangiaceae bacterium]